MVPNTAHQIRRHITQQLLQQNTVTPSQKVQALRSYDGSSVFRTRQTLNKTQSKRRFATHTCRTALPLLCQVQRATGSHIR